jgi:hypothetical protein
MKLEYYEYMVRSREDTFRVREMLGARLMPREPDCWFDRFGMSRTPMLDGRIVCMAGEHEDFCDPDFCIDNDVIILRPWPGDSVVTPDTGGVEIYGYPGSVFPPTDFHSATPVGEKIYIIGTLGYMHARREGATTTFTLDSATCRIESAGATSGQRPGWTYKHHASYDVERHAITVRGGNIQLDRAAQEVQNPGAHRLHLADMRWGLIAERENRREFMITWYGEPRQ